MGSTPASLVFSLPALPIIVPPCLYIPYSTSKLYIENLNQVDTLDPSQHMKSSPFLGPSRLPHYPWYLNPENLGNIVEYIISLFLASHAMVFHLLISPLTLISFRAPGELLQPSARSYGTSPQAPKLQYETSQKLTIQYQSPQRNGQDSSSSYEIRINSQSTRTTTLASRREAVSTDQSQMQAQTFSDPLGLAHCPSGLMITSSSESYMNTSQPITRKGENGTNKSLPMVEDFRIVADSGTKGKPCLTAELWNSTRTPAPPCKTCHPSPLDRPKKPFSHTTMLTSTVYLMLSESHGKHPKLSHLVIQSNTSVLHGTYRHEPWLFHSQRRKSTSWPSRSGPQGQHMPSKTCKNCMGNFSMHPSWCQPAVPTSPTWRQCSQPSTNALSYHTMLPETHPSISNGGQTPSTSQTFSERSLDQTSSPIHEDTPMRALVSALLSPSAPYGKHGASSPAGKLMVETLGGPKPLASNSSSEHSSQGARLGITSRSTVTTVALSKDGGRVAAEIGPPTLCFEESTTSLVLATALSTLVTSRAKTTPQTTHPEASIHPSTSYFHPSVSLMNSHPSLSTLTPTSFQVNSSLARAILSPSHSQRAGEETRPPRETLPLPMTLISDPRYSSTKCKTVNIAGARNNELPRLSNTSTPAAYSVNLTPHPSPLRPHCLARDRLRLWTPASPRSSQDHQGQSVNMDESDLARVLDVMAQAWAEGTHETYGSGLLHFHVYCDGKAIPESQRAPTSHILLSTFISKLAGAYSGKTIANYVYGIWAWHVLHGIPWSHNEPEIEALLTGASRLAPPTTKCKQHRPYTPDFMTKLKAHLQLQNPFDAATFACLTICFYAAGRVSEFTVNRLDGFNPTKHITWANLRGEEDRNGLKVTILHLPCTKTSSEGEDVTWARQHGPTDPYDALENHISVNKPSLGEHLFSYQWKSGR
jgi:hypothetical protein